MPTEPEHAWNEVVEQPNMKACQMRGAKGTEKARAATEMEKAAYAAAAAARKEVMKAAEEHHAKLFRPRTTVPIEHMRWRGAGRGALRGPTGGSRGRLRGQMVARQYQTDGPDYMTNGPPSPLL